MDKLVKKSFLSAFGVIAYIALLAILITNLEGMMPQEDNILMPITFLSLFVLSAAVTGSLVLGKPIMMYASGQKKEAMTLFGYTLAWLALGVVILVIVNVTVL